jgi:hypothetical protein
MSINYKKAKLREEYKRRIKEWKRSDGEIEK